MGKSFNNWHKVAKSFEPAINDVLKASAHNVQGGAQARAPVDTGFLKNSIYVVPGKYNRPVPLRKGQRAFRKLPLPTRPLLYYVAVGAMYGWFLEYGTTKMEARPYLIPAVEAERRGFNQAINAIKEAIEASA
jgi:hypothetical protein